MKYDDVLAVVKRDYSERIQFTWENEKNWKINFYDLTVNRRDGRIKNGIKMTWR